MRSSLFISLSVVFHVVCVTALAIGHFKNKQADDFQVESVASAGGNGGTAIIETTLIEPDPIKALPKKTQPKTSPKIAAVKPKQPIQKAAAPITELPQKVVHIESLDPQIEDAETVAVALPEPQPEADVSEKDVHTEAVSQDAQESEKDQAPVAVTDAPAETTTEATPEATSDTSGEGAPTADAAQAEGSPAAAQGNDGSSKAAAVSYLDLRQAPGNKAPSYPLQARLEKRQGVVGLLYRVTKEGLVQDIQVAQSSGYVDLDQAALKAIAKYRFVPGQEGWARHPVLFSLKGQQESMPSRLRSTGAQTE